MSMTNTLTNTLTASRPGTFASNTPASLADLAELIALDGVAAHHSAIVAAVDAAGIADRFPVLAHVAVDATAPPVARERAIGRLAAIEPTAIRPARTGTTAVWRPHAA